jgi:hypothetical protein
LTNGNLSYNFEKWRKHNDLMRVPRQEAFNMYKALIQREAI